MKLIGFNITKISSERFDMPNKEINIKTNLTIKSIESTDISIFKNKDEYLLIKFGYDVDYEPNFAKIKFEGNMLISVDSKTAKETIKEWEDKKAQKEVQLFAFNVILKKVTIKALSLEEELNLPTHIPIPKISAQKK